LSLLGLGQEEDCCLVVRQCKGRRIILFSATRLLINYFVIEQIQLDLRKGPINKSLFIALSYSRFCQPIGESNNYTA
jgi:hypothetical protein